MVQDRSWLSVLFDLLHFLLSLDRLGDYRFDIVIYDLSVGGHSVRPEFCQRPHRAESKAVASDFGSFAESMAEAVGWVGVKLLWVGYPRVLRVRRACSYGVHTVAEEEFRARIQGEPRGNVLETLSKQTKVFGNHTTKSTDTPCFTRSDITFIAEFACFSKRSKSLMRSFVKYGRIIDR